MERVFVTGCAGFIGMHLCRSLLENDYLVFGVDNMNNYYNPILKKDRLKKLQTYQNFDFLKMDISIPDALDQIFEKFKPNKVVNLAAQAGVRYSIENPMAYVESNIVGFMNILESCRNHKVQGLIYASSSSVYGGNKDIPFSIVDKVNKPISIYAASKISNELMAHAYSHLYKLNTTGLRFFTVYGPWGRPDMAMYLFADKILSKQKIPVFNHGNMKRDFTYIDDIVDGIIASIEHNYQCEIFNLGNNSSEDLMGVINTIEDCLGKKTELDLLNIQPGDVEITYADIEYSKKKLGYEPKTKISEGIPKFIEWYQDYTK